MIFTANQGVTQYRLGPYTLKMKHAVKLVATAKYAKLIIAALHLYSSDYKDIS